MRVKLYEEWSRDWERAEWWQRGRDYWDGVLPKSGLPREIFNRIITKGRGATEKEWHVLDRARRGDTGRWSTKN
jgi:hypothetical protein